MRHTLLPLLAAAALIVLAQGARAEVPYLIPVSGMLTDSSDAPLDGYYNVTFTIYTQQTGGILLWSDTYSSSHPAGQVHFTDGLFRVYLGENSANELLIDDFLDTDELWLAPQVGTDGEMTRVRLATVPWALEAEVCQQLGDLMPGDVQPAIPDDACTGNEFLQGWGTSGAICAEPTLPSTTLTTSDLGVTVQGAIDVDPPTQKRLKQAV